MPDWLTAFDDFLCQRWRDCIFCGQPGYGQEMRESGDVALTFAVCRSCRDQDPTEAKRQALVERHGQQQTPPQP